MRKKLIIANWKMNYGVEETLKFLTHFKRKARISGALEVVICPPFTSLYTASVYLTELESMIALGAQNCHWEDKGAFTGEVSLPFLKEIGCDYVVVGHSERRHIFGETNEQVALKAKAALIHEISPIFCVGEKREEREAGKTRDVVLGQLDVFLKKIDPTLAENLVIAYEPVWAIGTGLAATPEQAGEVHAMIRKLMADWGGSALAAKIQIVYGGSVSLANLKTLLGIPDIDGALIGGASLAVDTFTQIVHDAAAV